MTVTTTQLTRVPDQSCQMLGCRGRQKGHEVLTPDQHAGRGLFGDGLDRELGGIDLDRGVVLRHGPSLWLARPASLERSRRAGVLIRP